MPDEIIVSNATDEINTNDPASGFADGGPYPFAVYTLEAVAKGEPTPTLDQDLLEVQSNLDNDTGRIAAYQTYRDWYAGKHKAQVSARQEELLEAAGIPFSDNFTDIIVDAVVRRLSLVGVAFTPETESAVDVTSKIMRQNRMDIGTSRVHHNAVKLGDAFVILDFDKRRNVPTVTYNRPDIIRPEYDDDTGEKLLWVSKVWKTSEISPFNQERDSTIERMNVYWPDRIEKYYRPEDGGDWLPYMDVATDILWPVPWVNEQTGEGLGIPVFHFRNKTLDGDYGVSEIHKAISQQALLNKWLLDLDLVMDLQGFPQRWAKGVTDTSTDASGNTVSTPLPTGPGETWTTDNENADFGQFDQASPEGALKAIDMLVRHISASNATPIDDLLNPKSASGEALKMKDSGLSDKAEEKEMLFGNVWEDVFRYAHTLRNVFAQGETAVILDDVDIAAVWKDTTPKNEKATAEVLKMLVELGASNAWALSQFGVENVMEVMEQRQAELDEEAERMMRSITRGTDNLEVDNG